MRPYSSGMDTVGGWEGGNPIAKGAAQARCRTSHPYQTHLPVEALWRSAISPEDEPVEACPQAPGFPSLHEQNPGERQGSVEPNRGLSMRQFFALDGRSDVAAHGSLIRLSARSFIASASSRPGFLRDRRHHRDMRHARSTEAMGSRDRWEK